MLNSEKFKTAEERAEVFEKFCHGKNCDDCILRLSHCKYSVDACLAFWLDLEAEDEKPLPCPFCGSECELHEIWDKEECKSVGYNVRCTMCEYKSPWACKYDGSDAISAHNRVARAVMDAGKKEEKR